LNLSGEGTSEYYCYEDINYAVVELLQEAYRFRPESNTLLDVGCGRGRLGLEIEALGYKVTGLDNSPVACATARERITEVVELDITDYEQVEQKLSGRRFDWLLAADSLEHSVNPWAVLTFYRQFLKPDGRLLISLPNVVVWDNFFGRFNYADSGVMDRTHLRFFTVRSARQLVTSCGFALQKATWEPGIGRAFLPLIKRFFRNGDPSPGSILESKTYGFYRRYLMPIEKAATAIAPGLLAFRTVILARPVNS
jgi:SAM-dependent methyltransferase